MKKDLAGLSQLLSVSSENSKRQLACGKVRGRLGGPPVSAAPCSQHSMYSSAATEENAHAERGAAAALERVCNLESRLRHAIQTSGPLHNIFDLDRAKVDRELTFLRNLQ